MGFEDQVDLQVLINLKTNAAGALEAQAAISGVKREALGATPGIIGMGNAQKDANTAARDFKAAGKDAAAAAGDLGGPFSRLSGTLSNLAGTAGFGGIGLAAAGAVVGVGALALIGKDAVQNFEAQEQSTRALQEAYRSQGLDVNKNVQQVSDFIDQNKRYIDNQYEARDAIAILVRNLGDQKEAMRVANDAIDIAIAKNIPYAQAVDMLSKGLGGGRIALQDLGVSLKDINTLQKDAGKSAAEAVKADAAVEAAHKKMDAANRAVLEGETLLHEKKHITEHDLEVQADKVSRAKDATGDYNKAVANQTKAHQDAHAPAEQHAALLGMVEKHSKDARKGQDDLKGSTNELGKDWQDFTARIGPPFVAVLDQAVQYADSLVKTLEADVKGLGDFWNFIVGHGGGGPHGAAPTNPGSRPTTGRLAGGGVITEHIWGVGASGRPYEFGEDGPETVVPGVATGALKAGGGGGGINVYVTVQGSVTTEYGLAQSIAPKVRDELLRNGRNLPSIGLS